ncbi:MAG: antibiotic biosynthesis monooxygenase family protein [Acidobacteriota bacterium]
MFARNVSIRLKKKDTTTEFAKLFEEVVMPALQKQPGFRDAILLAGNDGLYMTSISLWESKEEADSYNTKGYPEILKSLEKVVDGPPKVRTTSVVYSTIHKLATVVAA